MVNDERVSIMYEGDGQNKTFTYPYSFTRKEDIVAYVTTEGKTKRISTNFEFNPKTKQYTYPKNGGALPRGATLWLVRETPRSNTVDLPNEPIYKEIQGQLDKIVRMVQELSGQHMGQMIRVLKEQFDTVLPTHIPNGYLRINRDGNGLELVEHPWQGMEQTLEVLNATKGDMTQSRQAMEKLHQESRQMHSDMQAKLERLTQDTQSLQERVKQEIRATEETSRQSLAQVEADITRKLMNHEVVHSVKAVENKVTELKQVAATMDVKQHEMEQMVGQAKAVETQIHTIQAHMDEAAQRMTQEVERVQENVNHAKQYMQDMERLQSSIVQTKKETDVVSQTVQMNFQTTQAAMSKMMENLTASATRSLEELRSAANRAIQDSKSYAETAKQEAQKSKEWAGKSESAKTGDWVARVELDGIKQSITSGIRSLYDTRLGNAETGLAQVRNAYVTKQDGDTRYALRTDLDKTYLKKADANTLYMTPGQVESLYLKKADANTQYAKASVVDSTYLKKTDANTLYAKKQEVVTPSSLEGLETKLRNLEVKVSDGAKDTALRQTVSTLETEVTSIKEGLTGKIQEEMAKGSQPIQAMLQAQITLMNQKTAQIETYKDKMVVRRMSATNGGSELYGDKYCRQWVMYTYGGPSATNNERLTDGIFLPVPLVNGGAAQKISIQYHRHAGGPYSGCELSVDSVSDDGQKLIVTVKRGSGFNREWLRANRLRWIIEIEGQAK